MALLVLCCLAEVASAQARTHPKRFGDVREMVHALAFDPTKFFRNEHVGDPSMIRIAYTGDDYAWPVYSIAIAEGCLEEETPSNECRSRVTARMVRAPAPPKMTRPRQRGSHLVQQLVEREATSRSSIKSYLGSLGVEWMEADLAACPGIGSILARSAELAWVPDEISNPGPREEITLPLHADNVQIVFDQYARRSTYDGFISEGSPASWAVQLSVALEPCWRPARIEPPWHR